jgi:hypothetical protein
VPKPVKIGKNVEQENRVFKACYDKMRNMGNPKAVTENPVSAVRFCPSALKNFRGLLKEEK